MKTLRYFLLVALLFAIRQPETVSAQRTGVEIWASTCGNCHTMQPADRYTARQWESIMTHMELYSRLTDSETEEILRFLKSGASSSAALLNAVQTPKITDSVIRSRAVPLGGPKSSSMTSIHSAVGDTVDPAETYSGLCSPCHGKTGRGDGPAAIAFNPKPKDLTDPELKQSWTDESLREILKNGKGSMPSFRDQLNEDQLDALIKYLRKFK